jgi:hypothetical protein
MASGPWSISHCLIEAWRLGVTDRQNDQSASQAALDFIRSREVDRVADYMRQRIRGNQEEWEQLMDDLVKDLQTFKNERDKSN